VVVLGLSAWFHDAAAAVVADGEVISAAQEERFTRKKHDPAMPTQAAAWCLESAGIEPDGIDLVVFYEKPLTAYERVLSTHASVGPKGMPRLARAVGVWSRQKLWVRPAVERLLETSGFSSAPLAFAEHHLSHAAAAFYPSPFEEAAVLTVDGVGEWATTTWGVGTGSHIEVTEQIDFPDSLGLLYSTATAYCGFAVNDGEYKLMGLAPYGEPVFVDALRDRVVHLGDDGSFRLDQRYFDYRAGAKMASPRLHELLGGPPRLPDEQLDQRHADVARSFQVLLEEALLGIARHVHNQSGATALCLGGGVALNCVANTRLLEEGPFKEIWVQPAAGDAGSAVGAALWGTHVVREHPRSPRTPDGMNGAALGPRFTSADVGAWLSQENVEYETVDDLADRCALVAAAIDNGAVVGWFQGPMEFGPRALGNRSILADPRRPEMVSRVNQRVKGREGFRPFAPAVTLESANDWFDIDRPLPYMLFTASVKSFVASDRTGQSFAEQLNSVVSDLPACTHVDGSARVQTVDRVTSPVFWSLLNAFGQRTGCPVLLSTSFNRADEPVVRSPADALRCAVAAGLDLLVIEDHVINAEQLGALSDRG